MKHGSSNVLAVSENCPLKIEGFNFLKAAWLGRLKLVRLLVDGGTDVDLQNEDGQTALIISILSDYEDSRACSREQLVQFLIEKGCNPNIRDCTGSTALMYACKTRKCLAIIRLLCDGFADPLIKDHSGCNSLNLASAAGYTDALKMLATTCKISGKDVIIVETPKSPGATRGRNGMLRNKKNILKRSQTCNTVLVGSISPAGSPNLHRRKHSSHTWERVRFQKLISDKLHDVDINDNAGEYDVTNPPPSPNMRYSPRTQSPSYVFGTHLNSKMPRALPEDVNETFSPSEEAENTRRFSAGRRFSLPADMMLPTSLHARNQETASGNQEPRLGPRGKCLVRQGSGAKLIDCISLYRPGTLPPLNISTRPPIPDIPSKGSPQMSRSNIGAMVSPRMRRQNVSIGEEDDDEETDSVDTPPASPPPVMYLAAKRRYSLQEGGPRGMSRLVAKKST